MRPLSYAAAANTPPAHLARAEHVYMRVGGQQKPLAATYAGPYLVLSKGAKTFTFYPACIFMKLQTGGAHVEDHI